MWHTTIREIMNVERQIPFRAKLARHHPIPSHFRSSVHLRFFDRIPLNLCRWNGASQLRLRWSCAPIRGHGTSLGNGAACDSTLVMAWVSNTHTVSRTLSEEERTRPSWRWTKSFHHRYMSKLNLYGFNDFHSTLLSFSFSRELFDKFAPFICHICSLSPSPFPP